MEVKEEEITPIYDLQYEGVDGRYRAVQIIFTGLLYLVFALLALFLMLLEDKLWVILAEFVILVALVSNMLVVRKAWMFKGYALRENDITYRSGIIFPTVTTIPFNRVQQVSVKQNPISRLFKLYSVEVVNGAQALSSFTIPGMTKENADQIKNIVIAKISYGQD